MAGVGKECSKKLKFCLKSRKISEHLRTVDSKDLKDSSDCSITTEDSFQFEGKGYNVGDNRCVMLHLIGVLLLRCLFQTK